MEPTRLATLVSQKPTFAWEITLLAAIGLGVFLWLLGRRLAQPLCAVGGMVLGGAGALAVGRELGGEGSALTWTVLGSITGCLLSVLFFKVLIGVSLAALLALAVPVATIMWEGLPPPTNPDSVITQTVEDTTGLNPPPTLGDRFTHVYELFKSDVSSWWAALGPSARGMVIAAVCGGGFVGLLLGLIYPYPSAAVESSLIGSLLALFGLHALLAIHLPSSLRWLPQNPRATVALLGLITLLGALVQWTILRSKTDTRG